MGLHALHPAGWAPPRQYVLQGESLDTVSDLLFAQRMLRKTRGLLRVPDVRKSAVLGRQYLGVLQAHSGMLPTQVTQKKKEGKKAARRYKK